MDERQGVTEERWRRVMDRRPEKTQALRVNTSRGSAVTALNTAQGGENRRDEM